MLSRYEKEKLVRVLSQIGADILILGAFVYLGHFLFYYPEVWMTLIVVFSVLLRTGWWEKAEYWSESRRKTKDKRF